MNKFFRSEQGYALILTLIFLPIFVGVGLLVIDVGRANNATQDHQAAADALALAGAAELDGSTGSMVRAQNAMTAITNTVSFLNLPPSGTTTSLTYDKTAAPFEVTFLRAIPTLDSTPIDRAYLAANVARNDAEARYVHVISKSLPVKTFFKDFVTGNKTDITVGGVAVATQNRSTCDLAPVFMCNPYSGDPSKTAKQKLLEAWSSGALHGRMVKLSLDPSNAPPGPGNVGFLSTNSGPGAKKLAAALAGTIYPVCVRDTGTVDLETTEPGAKSSAIAGFNTRFDIHSNVFGGDFSETGLYPPANNVRKGYYKSGGGPAACVTNPVDDDDVSQDFADSAATPTTVAQAPMFSDNVSPATDLGSGYENVMRQGAWNFSESAPDESGTYTYPSYWQKMYPLASYPNIGFDSKTHPNYINLINNEFGGREPSRYQVYKYEMTHKADGTVATQLSDSLAWNATSAGGELAKPQCYQKTIPNDVKDRRLMFVAVVDCITYSSAGRTDVPVDALAEVFLVNPIKEGSGKEPGSETMDFEFVDISEQSNGSVNKYLRTDIVLVR